MNWTISKFDSLTAIDLYKILQIRAEVFVVEQNCPYLDIDNKDTHPETRHLYSINNDKEIVAYARLIPPNLSFENTSSIGRVLVKESARNDALGKSLMQQAIATTLQIWPNTDIKIGAQYYLVKFYESLGFEVVSELYLEDDIEHVDMLYRHEKSNA